MIAATRVGYSFAGKGGSRVLHDISFVASFGEIVAIVGPSGCGKTTLLRLVSGYLKPTEGQIEIDGGKPLDYKHSIGVVYQDSRLIPWRNLVQNIQLPLEVLKRPIDTPLLPELLELLKLTGHKSKYPSELSGGQQERTALARALVSSPRFLLLDEPLDSTDYVHRLEIEDYIYEDVRKDQKCCLLVTHDLEQAAAVAHRIVLLGFSASAQRFETLDVPKRIQETRPSQARVMPEAAEFLSRLLAKYRMVTSS
ncbi:MAG TPA: ATP-binding cassette domain-containing protein [Candidatus Sulfotelmatobacter sp.]